MEVLILLVIVLTSLFVISEVKDKSQKPFIAIVFMSMLLCFVVSVLSLPASSKTPTYTDTIISDTVHHGGFDMKFAKPVKATIKVWKSCFFLCPDTVSVDIV